jgi:hypothetical protein
MTYQPRPFATGDTLVDSRDQIRTNFDIIQDRFEDNHEAFSAGTGRHTHVEMPNQGSIPSGLVANEGTLYVKVSNGRSQLFYTNEDSSNEYQFTRVNNTDFSLFGTNTTYIADHTGGWTYLPGGLLLKYGQRSNISSATGTVTFPATSASYTTVFSVTATMQRATGNRVITITSISLTGFNFRIDQTPLSAMTLNWTAIGN